MLNHTRSSMSRLLSMRTIWRAFLAVHLTLLLLWFAVPFIPITTPDEQPSYVQRRLDTESRIITVHPYSDTIRHPSRSNSSHYQFPHDSWDGHIFTWQLQQIHPEDNITLRLDNPSGITLPDFSTEIDLTALSSSKPNFIQTPIHISLATGNLHWPVPSYFSYADAVLLSHQTQHTWQNATLRLLVPETGTIQIWKNMPGWDTFNASDIYLLDDTDREQGLIASFTFPSSFLDLNATNPLPKITIPNGHLPTATYPLRTTLLTLLTPLFTTLTLLFSLLVFLFSLSILLFSLTTIVITNIPSLLLHLVPLYALLVLVWYLVFGRQAGFKTWSRRCWVTRGWASWVFRGRGREGRVWSVNGPIITGDTNRDGEGHEEECGSGKGRTGHRDQRIVVRTRLLVGGSGVHRRNNSSLDMGYGAVEKGGGYGFGRS